MNDTHHATVTACNTSAIRVIYYYFDSCTAESPELGRQSPRSGFESPFIRSDFATSAATCIGFTCITYLTERDDLYWQYQDNQWHVGTSRRTINCIGAIDYKRSITLTRAVRSSFVTVTTCTACVVRTSKRRESFDIIARTFHTDYTGATGFTNCKSDIEFKRGS